ncbi:MAG: amidohydrolase family protein [Alphaproteobacteria bacterium]|nr:amidohydrolase family protein [Alphaproteobacteria bacterium]
MPNATTDSLYCLSGAQILTFDADNTIYDHGEIWFEKGEIIAVCDSEGFEPPDGKPVTRQHVAGRVIAPGFINAHTHSYSAILKGTVEKDPLDIYMLSVIASGAAMTPRETYVSAQLDALSMLRLGITSVIDHYTERPALTAEGLNAVCNGFSDIGIRATVATMFSDRPYIESVPIDRQALPQDVLGQYDAMDRPDAEAYFDLMDAALRHRGNETDRVHVILGVDGPQRCSDLLIEMTGDFQKTHNVGLHTHMLETKTQAVMRNPAKESFVRRMVELGSLNDKSSLVHFIWGQDDDIAAASEAGVTVVHCPQSNTMLGAGICPVLRLRDQGIPIAYGTDGSNCGPASYLETLRLGAHLMRLTEPDFEKWPEAKDILRESFQSGARAMGNTGRIGTLAPGHQADFSVMKPVDHWHRPMGDPILHLFYYETGESVESVWVDGVETVKNGMVMTVDEQALIAEAEEIVIHRRENMPSGIADAVAAQYPAFRDMILKTLASDETEMERRVTLR